MLKYTSKNTIRLLEFYVAQTDLPPVLSLRGSLDSKLIELTYSVDDETEAGYGHRAQSMHQTILKVQNSLLTACCKNMLMYCI